MGVIIRQSIKGTIMNYLGAFLGFLSNMFIITRFLDPEDIGLTQVILHVGLLFSSLCLLGMSSSIMRFFPYFKDKSKKHNGFFFYIIILPLIGSLIFIPLYILLKEPVTSFFIEKSSLFVSYFYWVIPLIIFLTYWSVFENYSYANMRITIPKFIREVLVRILMIGVYLLYGLHVIGRDGFIGSYIAVYGVAMVVTLIYVSRIAPVSLKHDNSFISIPLRKDIGKYTLFLVLAALGDNLMTKLDTFMISSLMGLEYTGIYTITAYMAMIINIPARSITAISSPVAAAALRNGNIQEANALYKKVSLHQLMAGGLLFVLIWSNIDNIFAIIPNGEVYSAGKWVVFFMALAKLIEITLNFGGVLISYSRYYYWSLYFVFVIGGIGILTNYLLIPVLGISGAAIATLIATILSYSFQQWIVLRKIKGNPYSKGTLKVLLVMVLLFVLNYILPQFDHVWIDTIYRTIILVLVAVPLVYYLKISEEVNGIILMAINKLSGKK